MVQGLAFRVKRLWALGSRFCGLGYMAVRVKGLGF
jgi:hypothetical protein